MKPFLLALLISFSGLQTFSISPVTKQIGFTATPVLANRNYLDNFLKLTPHKYKELTGKRLSLKQQLALAILKSKLKNQQAEGKESNLGLLSLIFGAGAFVIAFVPVLGVLSFGFAIAAIILGILGLGRKKGDAKSIIGIVLGSAFLFLIILLIAALASWG
ncbi:MAG: hypothetical protein ABIR81_05495 [Ginsengibacter sp.]